MGRSEIVIVDEQSLKTKIHIMRGQQIMLDYDLAEIYGYQTNKLNEQVRNNSERFEGEDFMFQLTKDEFDNLISKNRISSWGGRRKLPFAFTEQGIYMLMTVLKGPLAIHQSRALVRLFKNMKDYIIENQQLNKSRPPLRQTEYNDFLTENPGRIISFIQSSGRAHDRYIVLDESTKDMKVYHCGASSKDAGKRITTITRISEIDNYKNTIQSLINNPPLLLK